MVFEILDGSFSSTSVMNMRGGNMVRGIFLEKGILEEITSFIVHDLEIGIVTSSCERVQEFLDTFGDS